MNSKWFETQTIIALGICFAYIGLVYTWTFYQPTLAAEQRDVVILLVGGLSTALGAVIQAFFNRSSNNGG